MCIQQLSAFAKEHNLVKSGLNMSVSIQTLSYNTSSERCPVLRQGSGLRPLLLQPQDSPTVGGLEGHGGLSATHVSLLPYHHGRRMMKWRAFQFRDPDDTYVYRARIEPHPPQLPVAAEAKQHTAVIKVTM